jgi:hypothetical protein
VRDLDAVPVQLDDARVDALGSQGARRGDAIDALREIERRPGVGHAGDGSDSREAAIGQRFTYLLCAQPMRLMQCGKAARLVDQAQRRLQRDTRADVRRERRGALGPCPVMLQEIEQERPLDERRPAPAKQLDERVGHSDNRQPGDAHQPALGSHDHRVHLQRAEIADVDAEADRCVEHDRCGRRRPPRGRDHAFGIDDGAWRQHVLNQHRIRRRRVGRCRNLGNGRTPCAGQRAEVSRRREHVIRRTHEIRNDRFTAAKTGTSQEERRVLIAKRRPQPLANLLQDPFEPGRPVVPIRRRQRLDDLRRQRRQSERVPHDQPPAEWTGRSRSAARMRSVRTASPTPRFSTMSSSIRGPRPVNSEKTSCHSAPRK